MFEIHGNLFIATFIHLQN